MNQSLIDRARRADLGAVMAALGSVRDRYDPHKYRLAGDVLSITGERFYIHTRGQGGAGPISLVMQLTGPSFPESVTYLVGQGGQRPTADPSPVQTVQEVTSSGGTGGRTVHTARARRGGVAPGPRLPHHRAHASSRRHR
jgi:hypothetical protein